MKYRLVVFDSDGTLADTLPWMRGIFNELAAEYGFRRVEPSDEPKFRNLEGRALLRELELPLWKLPQVVIAMRKRMSAHAGKFHTFEGVPAMLKSLSEAGATLAVVSSNSEENVRRILGATNADFIEHFLCGASMFGKAAKLRRALKAAGVAPAHAIYIGDELRDGVAAREVGMAFGAVAWGQHDLPTLQAVKPDERFDTTRDITRIVARR